MEHGEHRTKLTSFARKPKIDMWRFLRKFIPIAIILALIASWFHFHLLDGLDGFLLRLIVGSEDTLYAEGYTDKGFRSVRQGYRREQVERALGKPMEIVPAGRTAPKNWVFRLSDGGYEGWIYSVSRNDSHYRIRVILFKQGVVIGKVAEFYVD